MRSRSSHRSSMSHRSSSMHHRSSLSHRSSSMRHRISLSHRTGSIHHGSILSHRKSGISRSSLRNRPFHKMGISNAHAYSVGKATGININGSALGAHGAALHRFERMRNLSKNSNLHVRHTRPSTFHRRRTTTTNRNNKHRSSDFLKNMRVSKQKHRYTMNKKSYPDIGQEMGKTVTEFAKFAWIPFAIGFVIMLAMIIGFISIFAILIINHKIF